MMSSVLKSCHSLTYKIIEIVRYSSSVLESAKTGIRLQACDVVAFFSEILPAGTALFLRSAISNASSTLIVLGL